MERATNSMFSFPFDQMLDLFNRVLRVGNDTDEETLSTFSVLINEAAFKQPTLIRDERFVELLLEEDTKIGDVDSEVLNDYEEEEIDYDDRTISSDDDDRPICR
ncbi:1786_t:CDS:2 [Diversispora eburnea]|uniref:1786_t:CDS:1 n=1 Tax=Diversispora eburnea TaxID=1213867 RepID=A0A9N8UWE9_9GLOM|nr:1786_t:CDS:2 [Diversispora eburnea]